MVFDQRRSVWMLVHHHRKVDLSLMRDLTDHCGPARAPNQLPTSSPEWAEQTQAASEKYKWMGGIGFSYGFHPTIAPGRSLSASFTVRQCATMWMGKRRIHLPLFEREGWNWLGVTANPPAMDHRVADEMEWFLETTRCAFPIVNPDFALADRMENIAKHLGENPQDLAWPVLYYAPELVARHGVLSAPAWSIEELPDGGVFLQVLQNPFLATKKHLVPLAKHLELDVPR